MHKLALSGQETRLIVANNPEEEDKYNRYVEIVSEDANESDSWVVAGEGKYLTDRVYLVPSSENSCVITEGWRSDAFSIWSNKDDETFELDTAFKGKRKEIGSESFNYLAFDSSGNLICQEDSSGILQSPRLVLAVENLFPGIQKKNYVSIILMLLRAFC